MMKTLKESDIQKAVVHYCSTINIDKYLIYIPNEQVLFSSKCKQKWGWWKKMQAMGYKKGASDLFLALPRNRFHGLFLEIKTSTNKATASQLDFLSTMSSVCYQTAIAHSVDDAIKIIDDYILIK